MWRCTTPPKHLTLRDRGPPCLPSKLPPDPGPHGPTGEGEERRSATLATAPLLRTVLPGVPRQRTPPKQAASWRWPTVATHGEVQTKVPPPPPRRSPPSPGGKRQPLVESSPLPSPPVPENGTRTRPGSTERVAMWSHRLLPTLSSSRGVEFVMARALPIHHRTPLQHRLRKEHPASSSILQGRRPRCQLSGRGTRRCHRSMSRCRRRLQRRRSETCRTRRRCCGGSYGRRPRRRSSGYSGSSSRYRPINGDASSAMQCSQSSDSPPFDFPPPTWSTCSNRSTCTTMPPSRSTDWGR
mmetsp:Transcript_3019/g.9175  ORF Transcript_3019/g.9175 Transcript_3019/m.9175 type:complete len:297 (-) Transcript_3019:420-1310(-)